MIKKDLKKMARDSKNAAFKDQIFYALGLVELNNNREQEAKECLTKSAFSLALQADNTLFDEALHKNIIIVCPSTLLATVRTIYTIWRSEKSMQNSKEIAKIGGELYDRLVGFLVDLEKINDKISQTKECYDSALTKLQGNKGVVKSAIKLKELGSNSTKVLNPIWIERL